MSSEGFPLKQGTTPPNSPSDRTFGRSLTLTTVSSLSSDILLGPYIFYFCPLQSFSLSPISLHPSPLSLRKQRFSVSSDGTLPIVSLDSRRQTPPDLWTVSLRSVSCFILCSSSLCSNLMSTAFGRAPCDHVGSLWFRVLCLSPPPGHLYSGASPLLQLHRTKFQPIHSTKLRSLWQVSHV